MCATSVQLAQKRRPIPQAKYADKPASALINFFTVRGASSKTSIRLNKYSTCFFEQLQEIFYIAGIEVFRLCIAF